MTIPALPLSAIEFENPRLASICENHCCSSGSTCITKGTAVRALAENHCGLGDSVLVENSEIGCLWVPKTIVEYKG